MRRLAAIVLILALLAAVLAVPAASAASLAFVAVNDTIPLTLSGGSLPFFSGGVLYVPYTAFDVDSLGFYPSYSASGKTLALFSRSGRLVYNLADGTVSDESKNTDSIAAISRGGMVFVPAEFSAAHFGVLVSYLTSRAGYPVIRFTNGEQVYDDSLFLEKAENLIAYRVAQASGGSSGQTTAAVTTAAPAETTASETQTTASETAARDPSTILLAVTGADDLSGCADLLSRSGAQAAFFLTADEILKNAQAVRSLAAAGHSIGLALTAGDPAGQLQAGERALDRVLGRKTLLVLAPASVSASLAAGAWCVVPQAETPVTAADAALADGTRELVVCRSRDLGAAMAELLAASCKFEPLRETTVLP